MDNAIDVPQQDAKPMDEVALIAAIDDADNRAYGSNLSNLTAALSADRALAIDLYLGKNVDPAPEGQSNVIDRTVFETVQWILPSLCRIFANGDDVVTLQPLDEQDVEPAKQEGAYLNWLVTNKHPWFDLFLEWATDALLTKNAYFLVYRDLNRKVEIEKYTEQTRMGVAYLLQDPNCQLIESREYPAPDLPPEPIQGPQGEPILDAQGQPMMRPAMLYDVTIRRSNDQKDLCIRVLPPERVKVDQRAYSWRIDERCNYFEYWEETTLTELREQGFDVPTDIADDPELYTQEDYARDQYGERRLERYKPADPSLRRVKARMIWIKVDYDGDGKAELLQILRVGRKILYSEEVTRIPVASGVACPLPHRHVGFSIADMVADIQRIKTAIMRQGLDNLYIANNPQKVLDETKVNIDDALISRPGGIIRTSDVDAIRYEQAPFVFPQAMEGLEYMDQVRENRTGTNRYFTGIDQNSLNKTATGVQTLATMAAQRVEQIARILAFAIEDLFSIIHEHVLKMGHKRQSVQLQGKWVEVDPGAWRKRTDFKICVAFSAGNKDAQVGRLLTMLQQQFQAVELKLPVASPENIYETLVELTKAADFAAPNRFWTDPKTLPPAPPPPPPEGVIKAQIDAQSKEKITAAEIMQREVESQRKAALEKYAIDTNSGLTIVQKQLEHGHKVAQDTLNASHEALLSALEVKLDPTHKAATNAQDAVSHAMGEIQKHGVSLETVHSTLAKVMDHIKHQGAIAVGKKRIRKNAKGEIEGVDIHHPETGELLASHKAIKDKSGRITGME
jgi:hypothetical protein